MNENTPSHRKDKIFPDNNDLKLNSLSTPIEPNKYYNKILTSKYNENLNQKYKTIAQSRQNNNNMSNITDSIPKPQKLFINNYESLNKTSTTDQNNNKEKVAHKTKSQPKNRNYEKLEKNENMLSKSSNNMPQIKMKSNNIKINNYKTNENLADNELSDGDDSENLSKLAEDLLSISDEYNNAKLMRMAPIDKNDFIGESKVIFNINNINPTNQIKRFNDMNQLNRNGEKNVEIERFSQKIEKNADVERFSQKIEKHDKNKLKSDNNIATNDIRIEQNLTKTNMNIINMNNLNNINQMPKLQTQLYISPIQQYHTKNLNNNSDFNLNNDSTNFNSNNISKSTKTDGRKYSKIK